mmetsp:Transcript_12189/g.43074  ORF Transcript_12189/g.43074 Transcript_12189/m.43074 type:complete len:322 (+) Transcript_12189:310-1275(+)
MADVAANARISAIAAAFRLARAPRPRKAIEFAPGEYRAASRHIFFDSRHKIVLCAVPKVACTELIKLIYRLRGDANWKNEPHFRTDSPNFAQLPIEAANKIMNDPQWTKVAFLRDPATRLLSAFQDKFVNAPKRGLSSNYGIKLFGKKLAFQDFVLRVASNNTSRRRQDGLHTSTNAHWKPQAAICSLEMFLPVYSFVGRYENLREHSESLLRSLGLWDEFGAAGWAPKNAFGRTPAATPDRDMLFASNGATHRTGADSAAAGRYTAELRAVVERAYAMDYDIFRATGAFVNATPATGGRWHSKTKHLCRIKPGGFGEYCK